MINNKKVTAIVLVAGNSTRYGKNVNKNFEEVINGKTVLSYSLNEFGKNQYIDDIIVAVKPDEIENVRNIIDRENVGKEIKFVFGGTERKDSVYNSIKQCDSDIVIIHDRCKTCNKTKIYRPMY